MIDRLTAIEQREQQATRYDLVQVNKFYTTDHQMQQDAEGEWVEAADYDKLLSRTRQLREALEQIIAIASGDCDYGGACKADRVELAARAALEQDQ